MSLQQSRRIKQKILLDNKLQPYKNLYERSEKMFKYKSASVLLADKIYTQPRTPSKKKKSKSKEKKSQTPLQNKKLNSNSKSSIHSSSRSSSSMSASKIMMQGLEDRTLYLSQLVKKNSSLIIEKKQLEQRISFYKQKIAYQNRKLNQAYEQFKKLEGELEDYSLRIPKTEKNTAIIKQNQVKQRQQIVSIKKQIDKKVEQNEIIKLNIEKFKSVNKQLKKVIKTEHNQIRQTSQHSSAYKNLLRQSQKKLMCEAVHKQQLANSKANLMIEANQIAKKIKHLAKS